MLKFRKLFIFLLIIYGLLGNVYCDADSTIKSEVSNQTVISILSSEFPMIENHQSNVTFYCNVVNANPAQLNKVRWYLNGLPLKELPESSILILESVTREDSGNYSCEAFNGGQWSERSDDIELDVYYEPGNATLIHYPPIPNHRSSVTLTCTVDDGGNPSVTWYRWLRNGIPVKDVVTPVWILDPVGLDSRTNFSCYAYNEGGHGAADWEELAVHAAPSFIHKLRPYTSVLESIPEISLACRVECYPECQIEWFEDGVRIDDETDDRYFIKSEYLPVDPATGDFESAHSILYFNMTTRFDPKLDIFRDKTSYTCASTHNAAGPAVRSQTYFVVEYPPFNLTVTQSMVVVEEGSLPPNVLCSAKAFPEPSYEWDRYGEVLTWGRALIINQTMLKEDAGIYTCRASNRHGVSTTDVFMVIHYKPECSIFRTVINGEDTLICMATGNPSIFDFTWMVYNENDTVGVELPENPNIRVDGDSGYLILNDDTDEMKRYSCVANNTIGIGSICEIVVEYFSYSISNGTNYTSTADDTSSVLSTKVKEPNSSKLIEINKSVVFSLLGMVAAITLINLKVQLVL